MPTNADRLPPEIEHEIGPMIAKLLKEGWSVHTAVYAALTFGNWYVDLDRTGIPIRLIKDRSQYLVDGPAAQLKAAGLWKAFNDLQEFEQAILAWAAAPLDEG